MPGSSPERSRYAPCTMPASMPPILTLLADGARRLNLAALSETPTIGISPPVPPEATGFDSPVGGATATTSPRRRKVCSRLSNPPLHIPQPQ